MPFRAVSSTPLESIAQTIVAIPAIRTACYGRSSTATRVHGIHQVGRVVATYLHRVQINIPSEYKYRHQVP